MKQLGYHPNIVGMLGYCTKPSFLCLIMDFCPLGDLRHYLLNCRHQVSDWIVNTSLTAGIRSLIGLSIPPELQASGH